MRILNRFLLVFLFVLASFWSANAEGFDLQLSENFTLQDTTTLWHGGSGEDMVSSGLCYGALYYAKVAGFDIVEIGSGCLQFGMTTEGSQETSVIASLEVLRLWGLLHFDVGITQQSNFMYGFGISGNGIWEKVQGQME